MSLSNIDWGDVLTRTAKTAAWSLAGTNLIPALSDRDWSQVTVLLTTAAISAFSFLGNTIIQAAKSDSADTNVVENDPSVTEGN